MSGLPVSYQVMGIGLVLMLIGAALSRAAGKPVVVSSRDYSLSFMLGVLLLCVGALLSVLGL